MNNSKVHKLKNAINYNYILTFFLTNRYVKSCYDMIHVNNITCQSSRSFQELTNEAKMQLTLSYWSLSIHYNPILGNS
jgi:hypothetical protein